MKTSESRRLQHIETALEMLGITFCANCGKPHFWSTKKFTYINLRREARGDSIPVCMDDPVAARCFLQMVNTQEATAAQGRPHYVEYYKLPFSLAMWILESGAYSSSHPMNGFVQQVMTGTATITTEDLGFELLYWRVVALNGVIAGETGQDLLRMCGWEATQDEYLELFERCRVYAQTIKSSSLQRAFSRPDVPMPRVRTWATPLLSG